MLNTQLKIFQIFNLKYNTISAKHFSTNPQQNNDNNIIYTNKDNSENRVIRIFNILWLLYFIIVSLTWVFVYVFKLSNSLFIVFVILGFLLYVSKIRYINKIDSIFDINFITVIKNIVLFFIIIFFWFIVFYFVYKCLIYTEILTDNSNLNNLIFFNFTRRLILGLSIIYYIIMSSIFLSNLEFTEKIDVKEITLLLIALILTLIFNINYAFMFSSIILYTLLPEYIKNKLIIIKSYIFRSDKSTKINQSSILLSLGILASIFQSFLIDLFDLIYNVKHWNGASTSASSSTTSSLGAPTANPSPDNNDSLLKKYSKSTISSASNANKRELSDYEKYLYGTSIIATLYGTVHSSMSAYNKSSTYKKSTDPLHPLATEVDSESQKYKDKKGHEYRHRENAQYSLTEKSKIKHLQKADYHARRAESNKSKLEHNLKLAEPLLNSSPIFKTGGALDKVFGIPLEQRVLLKNFMNVHGTPAYRGAVTAAVGIAIGVTTLEAGRYLLTNEHPAQSPINSTSSIPPLLPSNITSSSTLVSGTDVNSTP